MRQFIPAIVAFLALATPTFAAKVKVWNHSAPYQYDKAQLKGVVITSEGGLRLSRQLKPWLGLDATHVWDIVEDKAGNLYVATGDDGKLYKVSASGQLSIAFESEESQILCLVASPDGMVYAGTGPNGHVIALSATGEARVLYKTQESYVWCLAVAGDAIYAGTGPKGRIYQIDRQGKGRLFYATKQDHILCLAAANDCLYAGTDKNGLVYRFDTKGKGTVLYHAPQAEIHSLLVTPDAVYAGTSSPRRRGFSNNSVAERISSGNAAVLMSAPHSASTNKDETRVANSLNAPSASADHEEKSNTSPSRSAPASGDNSLYRIAADGAVREIFRERALILCLLRQDNRIIIGTGMDGQLFELDEPTKERTEIARLDHGQIHALCRRQDGATVLGAGDPGKLYVLQDKFVAKGTVTSDVLDAKMVSRWGALRWKAETPSGTRVTLAIRSGNLAEPDETWSDWSPEQTDPDNSIVHSPNARFLQYRVTLTSDNPEVSPSFHSVAVRYMTKNQAPEVTGIEVPDLDASNQENPKRVKLHWTATDPNDDELTYSLFVRKDGWKNWVLLEDSLDHRDFEWDTTTTPSGLYQVKVVASDRKDNSPEDALTGERVSQSFPVCHMPPTVTLKTAGMDGDQAIIEASATGSLVRLTSASFAVNGKKWVNVFPTDGLFDAAAETFRFQTESLKPGTYVVVLRVRDAAGNSGAGDVVFTIDPKTAKSKK